MDGASSKIMDRFTQENVIFPSFFPVRPMFDCFYHGFPRMEYRQTWHHNHAHYQTERP
jgi:hypothetical protein